MVTIQPLTCLEDTEKALGRIDRSDHLFFHVPMVMDTMLRDEGFFLYEIKEDSQSWICLHKEVKNEIRVLFSPLSDSAYQFVLEKFKPRYIAYNELVIDPKKDNQVDSEEVIIDLSALASLGGSVHRKYRQAERKNDMLRFETYSSNHIQIGRAHV